MVGMKDYHIHTVYSDGIYSVDQMVGTAKALGFEEIGFAEHFNPFLAEINRKNNAKMHIYPEEIAPYLDSCKKAEDKHGIRVLRGFEVSWIDHTKEQIRASLEKNQDSLDFILVSTHHLEIVENGYSLYLGGDILKRMEKQFGGEEGFVEAYFARMKRGVEGLRDMFPLVGLAHMPVYGTDEECNHELNSRIMHRMMDGLKKDGLFVEVNFHYSYNGRTGLRVRAEDAKILRQKGWELRFGSDSHDKQDMVRCAKFYKEFEKLSN